MGSASAVVGTLAGLVWLAACGDDSSAVPDAGADAGEVFDAGARPCPGECTSPPNACFAPDGTCVDGECVYAVLYFTPCDDGDACTESDVCNAGVCAGAALRCDDPPPGECLGTTARSYAPTGVCTAGECDHAFADEVCGGACVSGGCVPCEDGWFIETVESECDGAGCTLGGVAIDASDRLHLVYRSEGGGASEVRYAIQRAGTAWTAETSPAFESDTADVLQPTAIAVDGRGGVHVSLRTWTRVFYSSREPLGAWTTSVVAGRDGAHADHPSMVLDDTGGVHITFKDMNRRDVGYAHAAAGEAFELESLGSFPVATPPRIALSPGGGPNILFGAPLQPLTHATRSDAGWTVGLVTFEQAFPEVQGLVADRAGGLHVTSATPIGDGREAVAVVYVHRAPTGAWIEAEIERVGVPAGGGVSLFPTGIAIDGVGGIHVAYQKIVGTPTATPGVFDRVSEVVYAHAIGPTAPWTRVSIPDSSIDWSPGVLLTLDAAGLAHVIYRAGGAIREATRCP